MITFKKAALRIKDDKIFLFLDSNDINISKEDIGLIYGEFYPEDNTLIAFKVLFGRLNNEFLTDNNFWYKVRDEVKSVYCSYELVKKKMCTNIKFQLKWPFTKYIHENYWVPKSTIVKKKKVQDFYFEWDNNCRIFVYNGVNATDVK